MSLQALLDRLEARVGTGWDRSTGNQSLAKIVEIGQDQLIDDVGEKRVWIDPNNNGYPPYLKTVAGQNEYDIIAENLYNVTSITKNMGGADVEVVPELVTRIFVDVTGSYQNNGSVEINPYSDGTTRQLLQNVPVRSEGMLENTPARVTFPFDTGTHDNYYYCEFIWQAPRLISEFIPLVVSVNFELALEEFVVGYCQEFEHGGVSDYILTFFSRKATDGKSWVDKYQTRMQRGAPVRDSRVIPRVC